MDQPELRFLRAIRPVFCRIVIVYLLTMWRCDILIKQDDLSLLCISSGNNTDELELRLTAIRGWPHSHMIDANSLSNPIHFCAAADSGRPNQFRHLLCAKHSRVL
jgi:hypothetical protein